MNHVMKKSINRNSVDHVIDVLQYWKGEENIINNQILFL